MPAPARIEDAPSASLKLSEPAVRVGPESVAPPELPPPERVSGATIATLAALAGMASIALGLWAFASSVRDEGTTQIIRPPISEAAQAISLLAKPTTARVPFAGSDGSATLAVGANGRGILVLDGLGFAPVGRAYQAWVQTPGPRSAEPLSAAVFTGVETVVPLSARVTPGSIVGITIERAGGAEAPTQPLRLLAQRPAG